MRLNFHRIAYEALDVCNAVKMATIDAAVATTRLPIGARALDIGCGNASVSIRLAEAFGLSVDAVELDPAMADLARTRIAGSDAAARITLRETRSAEVLSSEAPYDLIVALGVTEPVDEGVREPQAMFEGLRTHLLPGGWLLWGDLVWTAEPPAPVRQLAEMNNTYADDAGWRAAATAAEFEVVSPSLSSPEIWDGYTQTMQAAGRAWLDANPDHEDAPTVAAGARRVGMLFDYGRGTMGFGLYLLKRR